MHRIYKVGILQEHVAKNPVLHVETRSKSVRVMLPAISPRIFSRWQISRPTAGVMRSVPDLPIR